MQAAQQVTHISSFKAKMRNPNKKTHAGSAACPTDCPPGGPYTMQEMAMMTNRKVPGTTGFCGAIILPLSGSIAIGATTVTLTETSSPVGLCVDSIVAVQNAVEYVLWSNLTIRNSPQWIMGEQYDEMLFAPDAECSCCLPGDCIEPGASVSVTATVQTVVAGAAYPVALYLVGSTLK